MTTPWHVKADAESFEEASYRSDCCGAEWLKDDEDADFDCPSRCGGVARWTGYASGDQRWDRRWRPAT